MHYYIALLNEKSVEWYFFPQARKDKGGAGYKSMGGGGGGKSNGNTAQPSRLTMSRLEQVMMMYM